MSEQQQAQPDANAEWIELKSKNGKPYRILAPDGVDSDKLKQAVETATSSSPSAQFAEVYWAPGMSAETSSAIQKAVKVSAYDLDDLTIPIPYQYNLRFQVTVGGNFWFHDGEDEYYIWVFRMLGNHSVWYNSGSPTIIRVVYDET